MDYWVYAGPGCGNLGGIRQHESGPSLGEFKWHGVGPLFKNEMQTMLPYTKNSSFNTKDAQSIVQSENTNDNLWDTIQKKTNKYGNEISQKAKDLINDAKSWFKH